MLGQTKEQRKESWRGKYPTIFGALLSIAEMIFTMAILGCEIGGIFVHFPRMNAFVGYWVFPFFMCACISLAGASCCCRIHCCGIVTLVFQCLAIPMALAVIGFDIFFLINPTLCYFTTCSSSYYTAYTDLYNTNTLYSIKVPLIAGQLSAGVLMLFACIIYIIIFVVTSYRVRQVTPLLKDTATQARYSLSEAKPTNVNIRTTNPTKQYSDLPPVRPPINAPQTTWNPVICPMCSTVFQISSVHRY